MKLDLSVYVCVESTQIMKYRMHSFASIAITKIPVITKYDTGLHNRGLFPPGSGGWVYKMSASVGSPESLSPCGLQEATSCSLFTGLISCIHVPLLYFPLKRTGHYPKGLISHLFKDLLSLYG